ncbi:MAG: DUF1700 domain-containing protein [Ruminococcaceae bacterium]|nr:DUF1700 domain-containing protein [Oscillospiraceae bacterium]
MNKIEFLSRLRIALAPLPEDERDAAMVYYEEFFDDAGVENEQSVIAEFGSPEELAKSIVEENNRDNPAYNQGNENGVDQNGANPTNQNWSQNGVNSPNQNVGQYGANTFNNANPAYSYNNGYNTNPPPVQQSGKWSGSQIALVVILLVLSSPIWLGLLAAVVGVVVAMIAVVVSLVAALGVCAITFFIAGCIGIVREPAIGLMLIGTAFVCAGMFPLAIVPLYKLIAKGIVAMGRGIGKLFRKITGREEKNK